MNRTIVMGLLVLLTAACAWGILPLQPLAIAQDPKPAPTQKKDYELRIIRMGNTFQAVRFKPATGESWTMKGDSYEKIPETGPVPAGDYDIILVTDDTNWMAFRIDGRTGATWQLRGNRWNRVTEPRPEA
jgi:hypothetical protein